MKRECPHCKAVLDFGDRPLSFCAFCGHSLSGLSPAASPATEAHPESTSPTDKPLSEAATLAPSASSPAERRDDPEVVGNYRLIRPLGEGGMGTVYEAEDRGSGRRVALKLISSAFGGSGEAVERFRQEGRLASALVHPRCVFVYAADEEGGRPYIVMELMPGKNLDDLVRASGPMSVPDAIEAILDVIDGLKEAHQLGIIHRDVKPSNCFIEDDGRVKVGDFGLAKSLERSTRLTRTGSFLGTPLFASPEQVRAEKLTPQSDLYSVAATLYFLLVGKAPFESGDPVATLARIVTDDPPPMRGIRPEIPELLDRVVLRGLERNRERRYADLEQFRLALLPFLPGRSQVVGLGLRFFAYFIDLLFVFLFVSIPIGITSTKVNPVESARQPLSVQVQDQRVPQLIAASMYFLYFLPEMLFGWSLGKYFLGLRVRRKLSDDPPGLARGLLRTLLFYLLFNLGNWLSLLLVWNIQVQDPAELLAKESPRLFLAGILNLLSTPLGIALTCFTMRARNGMRGVHDFASGTRVILLPRAQRRRGFAIPCQPNAAGPDVDLPSLLGPYRIKGALDWHDGTGTVLADDPNLGRDVLLWFRPDSAPPLDPGRRGLGRVTRLRWLSAGRWNSLQWDAFLLPSGCPLPVLARSQGPLDWPDARAILEQLSRELDRAAEDGTLPSLLTAEQVWVQGNGRVVLLDAPVVPLAAETPPAVEDREQQCLALVREVAALTVLGQAGPLTTLARGKKSPLPIHAARLVRRLSDKNDPYRDVNDFRDELHETQSKPVEVTRLRRAAHLAVLGGLLLLGSCCCVIPVGLYSPLIFCAADYFTLADHQARVEGYEKAAGLELACLSLQPNLWGRVAGIAQYEVDQQELAGFREQLDLDRQKLASRRGRLNVFTRQSFQMIQSQQAQAQRKSQKIQLVEGLGKGRFRPFAQVMIRLIPIKQSQTTPWLIGIALIWPGLWILWAFLARGGLSYALTGITVVRRDGRPAGRLRCLWRALLVWAPVSALLAASVWLDAVYWTSWQPDDPQAWLFNLAKALWWCALGLLACFAVLALRTPGRAPNDRLAGTYLVPK